MYFKKTLNTPFIIDIFFIAVPLFSIPSFKKKKTISL